MTTEIAVLNRLGVALATDSAVTITGGGRTKIFNSADKLFEISSVYPVAVMVNGNMDCIGVPWEIVIKDFRTDEGNKTRPSIDRWLEDFISYVETYPSLDAPTADDYIRQIVDEEISLIQSRIGKRVQETVSKRKSVDVKLISEFFSEVVKLRAEDVSKAGRSTSLMELKSEAVLDRYGPIFAEKMEKRFVPYKLESHEVDELNQLLVEVILAPEFSDLTTGLVCAGFGSESTFPEISAVEVSGKVMDRLKVSARAPHKLDSANDAGRVVSFAQTDVIERLLGGADPQFVEKTAQFIESAVRDATRSIKDLCSPKRLSSKDKQRHELAIDSIVEIVTREYRENTSRHLTKRFTQEFDRMIAMMPKQELVELAEALVSITAVERKASSDEGTVGGPIDVALITKHDGFVWIKRKHYFKAHLNPNHFRRKYGNSVSGGEHEDSRH